MPAWRPAIETDILARPPARHNEPRVRIRRNKTKNGRFHMSFRPLCAPFVRGFAGALLLILFHGAASGQVPHKLNYQGFLTDLASQPINASPSMVFKLYNVASGGSALYTETQTVTVSNGNFDVAIGSITPLNLPFDVPYYLGVTVAGDGEMVPRQALLASPYALQAAGSLTLASTATIAGSQITGPISTATVAGSQITGPISTATIPGSQITGSISTATLPTANLSGTVPVSKGGTGLGTLTSNALLVGQGTTPVATVAGTFGQVLAGQISGLPFFTGSPVLSGNLVLQSGAINYGADTYLHSTGNSNLFLGDNAGNLGTTGTGQNTGVGYLALSQIGSAAYNTAVGAYAMRRTTSGILNTGIGTNALEANVTGSQNTAIGTSTLYSNGAITTAGSFVVGVPYTIQSVGTTNFVAIGASANTVGTVFIASGAGSGTGTASPNASNNTAVGYSAGGPNATGRNNTSAGNIALQKNYSGQGNTAVGAGALQENIANDYSTALGLNALSSSRGNYNIGIGTSAGATLAAGDYNIYIGTAGVGNESQTMRIGDPFNQSRTFVAAVRGTTTDSADAIPVVIDSNGQLGTVSSSRRFKDDIADMQAASEGLMKLRAVTFRYKNARNRSAASLQYGLIAEEVAEVYPGLVAHTADGKIETVMYQFLPPMLLNEFQKQQRTIQAQAAEVARQAARIAELERDRLAQTARDTEAQREREMQAARIGALERQGVELATLKLQMAEMAGWQRQAAALARGAGTLASAGTVEQPPVAHAAAPGSSAQR
jgi:hypothetical protein